MLNRYRNKVERLLEPVARKMGKEANKISYFSLLFAFLAGLSSFYSRKYVPLLLLFSLFTIINGFLDAIDGEIARIYRKASIKGDFIDHAIDRFSDAFIIGGVALSKWCSPAIGIISLTIVFLVSYMGTQAQAVGYRRVYGGPLGRADRIAIFFVGGIAQYFIKERIYGFYLMEWILLYFIFAGIITIVQRFYLIIKWLNRNA